MRLYEEALKLDPENHLVLNNFAYSLAERDIQLERALEMSRKAVDVAAGECIVSRHHRVDLLPARPVRRSRDVRQEGHQQGGGECRRVRASR